MKSRNLGVAWALCGLALLSSALLPSSGVFAAGSAYSSNSSSSDSSGNGNASTRKPRTVPYWSSTFTDPTNGVAYPFTMVGSDPRLGQSTTVDTRIIPLSFTFVAGAQDVSSLNIPPRNYFPTPLAVTMDGIDHVADTIASPIFTPANFLISGDSGVQFGDAFARAQFGMIGTDYHVRLGQPRVADTVSIQVPETMGVAVLNPLGVLFGRVDATWFREQLAAIIDAMDLKPTTLPIFLSNNVGQYSDGMYIHCCSLGGHGAGSPASDAPITLAGKEKIRTFVYSTYIAPNSFSRFPAPFAGLSDINSLSHEIAEWIDNPFGMNQVQPYRIPTAPPGACSSDLETGDVLAGVWFPMPGNPDPAAGLVWHPQDEAFLNWFARDGEGAGLAPADGRYTLAGPMTTGIGGPYGAFGHSAHAC
ncbi:MAG TPA: hypothetical protein VHW94_07475 [Candidatus Dormibacteraeota bacterium]|nr:hypothetical protein [Candidatus Dormibacteraeota bacterium]